MKQIKNDQEQLKDKKEQSSILKGSLLVFTVAIIVSILMLGINTFERDSKTNQVVGYFELNSVEPFGTCLAVVSNLKGGENMQFFIDNQQTPAAYSVKDGSLYKIKEFCPRQADGSPLLSNGRHKVKVVLTKKYDRSDIKKRVKFIVATNNRNVPVYILD